MKIKSLVVFYLNYTLQHTFKIRIKPRVLQMPITSKCNSRCVTCGIWKDKSDKVDLDASALKKALEDGFFSKVQVVGLNGGEPSLYYGIEDLLDSLFVLKHLKRIHFISNGMITQKLLQMMEVAKQKCLKKNISVYLTISIDGIDSIHNEIRGIPNAFSKTLNTLLTIKNEQHKYCDVLDVGCTLSQHNIDYVIQTQKYLEFIGVNSYYHPAVPNRRLHNFDEVDFSVINNEHSRMLATEYFFGKFKYGKGIKTRLRSFLTYYYLLNHGSGRLAGCNYLRSDVTITENMDLCLCATASNVVGNLKEKTATELLKDGRLKMEEREVTKYCNNCVHYIVFPSIKGMYLFLLNWFKPIIWIKYKILAIW